MGLLVVIIIIAVVILICRFLRSRYKWVDFIVYGIMFIEPIMVWISSGFWAALVTFFCLVFVMALLFGIGSNTELKRFGKVFSMECQECGYGKVDIIDDNWEVITFRCKRCGLIHTADLRTNKVFYQNNK